MSARARHWADIRESTWVAGIGVLYALYRWFGRRSFRVCVGPVVLWFWLVKPLARRSSLEYLARLEAAHGVFGRRPGWRQGLRHMFVFAESMLDKLLAISGRYPPERVRCLGRERLVQAARSGRGGVIFTAHLGCLELCQALAGHNRDVRLSILVHTAHAERFNRLLRRFDADGTVELLQVTEIGPDTAMHLSERVAAGGFVAIAADRIPVRGGRTVLARFLDHPALFPIGPYVLAALLRCPVYTMAGVHEGAGYVVRFEPFAERIVLPRGDRETALAQWAGRFAAWLEARVREAPYDWFNFYPFWDTQVTHARHPL